MSASTFTLAALSGAAIATAISIFISRSNTATFNAKLEHLQLQLLALQKADIQTLCGASGRKDWLEAHPTYKTWAANLRSIQKQNAIQFLQKQETFGWTFHAKNQELYNAAEQNQLKQATEALHKGYSPNREEELHPKFGTTPLMEAAFHGNSEILKLYIEHNAQLNVQSGFGWTALHYACQHNSQECAALLVAAGCNRSIQNNKGKTAHFRAVKQGKNEIATLIADPPKKMRE